MGRLVDCFVSSRSQVHFGVDFEPQEGLILTPVDSFFDSTRRPGSFFGKFWLSMGPKSHFMLMLGLIWGLILVCGPCVGHVCGPSGGVFSL